jgi:molybdenum cofactor biosynthesis enzyme MoaA
MGVNRDELKRMIDHIPEQDAIQLLDFIGYLNLKREREAARDFDVDVLAEDADLIQQVQASRKDRNEGRVYAQNAGLDYLRIKVEEFERGQGL